MANSSLEKMLQDEDVGAFNRWRQSHSKPPDLSEASLEMIGNDSLIPFAAVWLSIFTLCAWGGLWVRVLIGDPRMGPNGILIFTTTVTMLFLFLALLGGYSITHKQPRGLSLTHADFRFTNFCNANLRNADLTGADIFKANVFGADLRGVKITAIQLAQATNIEHAFLDPGVLADVLAFTAIQTLAEKA